MQEIETKPQAQYILLIENLTAFERYTREIRDNGVVIYTNGFPSRHLVRLLKTRVDAPMCPAIYHWGDIDVGGYRIYAFLSKNLGEIIPHQMLGNPPGHSDQMMDAGELLAVLGAVDTTQGTKLQKQFQEQVHKGENQHWVEQELTDPVSPLG